MSQESISTVTSQALSPEQLAKRCDVSAFPFATTAELDDVDLMTAQERAYSALDFGAEVSAHGFNVFAVNSSRDTMDEAVKALLRSRARKQKSPSDWVYLNNFASPHQPVARKLPPGRAPAFHETMQRLVEDLQLAVHAAFESEEYQARRTGIEQTFARKQEDAFKKLQEQAAAKGIGIIRSPMGFTLAPVKDGVMLSPEAFANMPQEEQDRIQSEIQGLEKELEGVLRSIPAWDKERRLEIRNLNQETTRNAADPPIEEAIATFSDLPKVKEHLERVRTDLIEKLGMLLAQQQSAEIGEDSAAPKTSPFSRYEVNVFVTNGQQEGAPVVEELHPTLANLMGRVEHISRQGVLATDFRLIKPGALHRANGGYLLLDARALLTEPFAWAALKRALKTQEIRIENAIDLMSLTSTISLQPDPIPLNVKVILIGERSLYYLLSALDPEFREHFKVLADFDDTLDRTQTAETAYAGLIATIGRARGVSPLDREAVGRVIERSARMAADAAKLSLIVDEVGDLLVEADFWARREGKKTISAEHIQQAIDKQIFRLSRIREHMQESVLRDIALIDTVGAAVGQVNGLSVSGLGDFAFGRPSKITARVSPGSGGVVDIEREVKLGGPIHSKGVLILSGFLSGRYALDAPISLSASLVFEQSYGGVEGDSASAAELFALLSALSGIPLRQDLAVTGSVNQHGAVQAVGGVNEKIEGFFDVCKMRGLTGTQGVLIPTANIQHLMLRDDVIDACAADQFSVYSYSTIDDGIALMTGNPAGERTKDGIFPVHSINRLVEDRLRSFAQVRRAFGSGREKRDE